MGSRDDKQLEMTASFTLEREIDLRDDEQLKMPARVYFYLLNNDFSHTPTY